MHYGTAVYIPDGGPSGYALIAPRRGPEFVRGLAPTPELRRWLRVFRRPPLLAWYLDLGPVALMSAALVIASLTSVVQRRRVWIPLSLVAAGLSLTLTAPVVLERAANPFHNMLQRDVIGSFILAAGIPLVVSSVAVALSGRPLRVAFRLLIPSIAGLLCIALSPLYALLIHCTSGDCL